MPRPKKWRKVCCLPTQNRYGPLGNGATNEGFVIMSVEEYETIRLIDLEGMTQEECSSKMNVARTTVQSIYVQARKKLAQSLVNGNVLRIEGGDYKLCDGSGNGPHCGNHGCHKHKHSIANKNGGLPMKIIIPVNNNQTDTTVCPSFGRAPYFLLHNTETKETTFIDNSASASSGGAGIKAAQTIVDQQANAVLTPRCGENAAEVLLAGGIKLYKTIDASAVENIHQFQDGKLPPLSEIHAGLHNHG